MRFFIKISYNGTNYHGWQVQPNANTVQHEINKAISVICNTNIEVIGAGRTDSGVHAKQMFAHFDFSFDLDIEDFIFKLNNFLPNDIAILNIFKVKSDAHSRFDAESRTYKYHVVRCKSPLNNNSYLFLRSLDIELMNEACRYIVGNKDYTSFSKLNTQTFTNNCNVTFAHWEEIDNELIFTITSNRFLRNMVRAIVGTLLDVGSGKIKVDDLPKIIKAKDRSASGFSVPANALCLFEIKYPIDIIL